MATKKEKLRLRLQQELAAAKPTEIDEPFAESLRAALAPVSEKLWRNLILHAAVPLHPLVEGVNQEDLQQLERTLLRLAHAYLDAPPDTQKRIRALVIRAKDHARFTARNPKVDAAKRAQKDEMLLWILTWLGDPSIFELWLPLRKQQIIVVPRSPLE